jgi:hypothetical protein
MVGAQQGLGQCSGISQPQIALFNHVGPASAALGCGPIFVLPSFDLLTFYHPSSQGSLFRCECECRGGADGDTISQQPAASSRQQHTNDCCCRGTPTATVCTQCAMCNVQCACESQQKQKKHAAHGFLQPYAVLNNTSLKAGKARQVKQGRRAGRRQEGRQGRTAGRAGRAGRAGSEGHQAGQAEGGRGK